MESIYEIGNQRISQSEIEEQVRDILKILKEKKQTYAINKFVLEQAIQELYETIF